MKTNAAIAWLVLIGTCVASGCRLERAPAASPFANDEGALQAGDDEPADAAGRGGASALGSGGAGGASAAGSGGTGGAAGSGAGGQGGASGASGASGMGGASGAAGAAPEPDASMIGDAGGVTACDPDVLTCNPVTNEGCPPPMQCAVDLLSDVLAGYCIFSGPVADGCFNSGVTESCPPMETCFNFECRTLCFCDDDCKEGQCCVDPVGELGFKACGEC